MTVLKTIPKLIGVDLETTGTSFSDRIVEFAFISFVHGEKTDTYVKRVNPEIPIPPQTTAIHGIHDEDVADKLPFNEFADEIGEKLEGATLFGYNVMFDFRVLSNELVRCGRKALDPKKFLLLDPFSIWKKKDPKTLVHAYQHFCQKELVGAHGALADIEATHAVLEAQIAHYDDLPATAEELGSYCYPKDPSWVCSSYHFIWNDKGEILCNFGKPKGTTLKALLKTQSSFCHWILRNDFPEDVKELLRKALEGHPLPSRF